MIDCEAMALRIERECYKQGKSINSVLQRGGLDGHIVNNIRESKRGPTAETLIGLHYALGKSVDWILGLDDDLISWREAAAEIRAAARKHYANGVGNQWAEKEARAMMRAAEIVEQMGVRT